MKRSRFSEEQISGMLKSRESGGSTAELCREHGIGSATFFKWKAKFSGREVSDTRRLQALRLGHSHASEHGHPVVESALRHGVLAAKVSALRACFVLDKDADDLLVREPRHIIIRPKLRRSLIDGEGNTTWQAITHS